VNALGQLRSEDAADPLLVLMYRAPELMMQIRRALVASGPKVIDDARSVLRGEHVAIEAMHVDKSCDDAGTCNPVAARDFYAAIILGDMHATEAVPELLAALKRRPLPVYYADDQPSPNTQHNAIADALRRIGSPDAAATMRDLWSSDATAVETRVLALGAYPFVARDASGVAKLTQLVASAKTDDTLRFEAATALARLSRDPHDLTVFTQLAKKYLDVSATRDARAAKKKPAFDAATKVFDAAKAKLAGDKAALRKARAVLTQATREYRNALSEAKAFGSYAHAIQTNAARIEVASRCKDDLACYAATLASTTEQTAANVAPYIPAVTGWSEEDKQDLHAAEIERAMIELAKAGPAATPQTDKLLAAASTDVRLIRQAVLLALPAIAPRPCTACVRALDQAIAATEGKATLADLKLETEILRNYFAWAK
jgi:hypothetical protein